MPTQTFNFSGLLIASPSRFEGNLNDSFDLTFKKQYLASEYGSPSLKATLGSPFIVAAGVLEKINLFAIRVRSGGPIFVMVTTAAGVDQIMPVSDSLHLHNPIAGTEITQIKVFGTAEIDYTVAGTGVTQTVPPPPPPQPPALDALYSCDPAVRVLDAVYLVSSGTVAQADASVVGKSPVIGFVVSKAAPNLCVVRRDAELSGFSLVGGQNYYLDTVAGQISIANPVLPGQVFQRVGYAKDGSILAIEVDQDIIILT